MYAHKVPLFYIKSWANKEGKSSLYVYDKEMDSYASETKNASNAFGESNYYYFDLFPYEIDSTEGFRSGAHMHTLCELKKVFPQFFTDLEEKFKDCSFYYNEDKILKDPVYDYLYYFYSVDRRSVKGKDGKLIHPKTMMKIIKAEWDSAKYKKSNEENLSRKESYYSDIVKDLLDALNNCKIDKLQKLHNSFGGFVSLQQIRMPLDNTTKLAIDQIVEGINSVVDARGLDYLHQTYSESDYKDISQVQLLRYFNKEMFEDYTSVFDSLSKQYEECLFLYLKSTESHKFVIGDNPVVSIDLLNGHPFLALPISPEYCLIICGSSIGKKDHLLSSNNRIIDYINFREYTNSAKIISVDKQFRAKDRDISKYDFEKIFNKAGLTFLN